MALEIAEKLYYRIGEVEEIAGVPAYVLRYWESEFKLLRPKKNPAGQRLYRRRDVDLVQRIKALLYDERLTLEGARKLKEMVIVFEDTTATAKQGVIYLDDVRFTKDAPGSH